MTEFPKWIRHPGQADVLVANADAEAEQLATWEGRAKTSPKNPLLMANDDKVVSTPATFRATSDTDITELRVAYKAKFGKKPFGAWGADELRAKLADAA